MKLKWKKIPLLLAFGIFLGAVGLARAQTCDSSCSPGDTTCLNNLISDCQKKVTSLQGQANTLSNQIAQFDYQIKLTTLKIAQTEEQIKLLGGRIDQLETSLGSLSNAFSERAIKTYKMTRSNEPLYLLLNSQNITDIISSYYYLAKIQEADRNLLVRLQKAQNIYKDQKTEQETLAAQLADQKSLLNKQKAAKAQLLAVTKNDGARYQQLLAKALAELEAIQSIIAGKGQETSAGQTTEGSRIASIISGASTCSSGGHLHFEVVQGGAHQNPANFLSPKGIIWDNAPDGSFSFSGGWQWPVNDPIRITQGYGMTYYAATLKYYGGAPHTGIDMLNDNGDLTVKAVRNGELFRGAIGCGGGTLRYVKVKQADGYDTYYLHVNY